MTTYDATATLTRINTFDSVTSSEQEQPYSYSVPSPHRLFKNSSTEIGEQGNLTKGLFVTSGADPGSGAFLTPESGMNFLLWIPDPTPYFRELGDNFWVKSFNSSSFGSHFLYLLRSPIVCKYVKLMSTKKIGQKIFYPSSTYFVLIWDPEWKKIRIRNNHPGSATPIVIVICVLLFLDPAEQKKNTDSFRRHHFYCFSPRTTVVRRSNTQAPLRIIEINQLVST